MNKPKDLISAFRDMNKLGAQVVGVGLNASLATGGNPWNSVNAGWRDAIMAAAITVPWSFDVPFQKMADAQDLLTEKIMPRIKQILPCGGHAYMNEGDPYDPNWQFDFFGPNYARLTAIKKKHDPNSALWCLACPGSEEWYEEEQPSGRLCRAAWVKEEQ